MDEKKSCTIAAYHRYPEVCKRLENIAVSEGHQFLGSCNDYKSAVSHLKSKPAEVVFLDFSLRTFVDLSSIKYISSLANKSYFIVYSDLRPEAYAAKCIEAGASAYLHPTISDKDIGSAITCVMDGKLFMSKNINGHVKDFNLNSATLVEIESILSPRELEIFYLLGNAENPNEISSKLGISPNTVQNFLHLTKKKLRVKSNHEIVYNSIRLHVEKFEGTDFDRTKLNALSDRESELLPLFAQGLTNIEIGKEFSLSKKTIESHCASMAIKLGCGGRRDLVRASIHACQSQFDNNNYSTDQSK